VEEEWQRARDVYLHAVRADQSYKQAAKDFVESQQREPCFLPTAPHSISTTFWAYRDKILMLESTDPQMMLHPKDGEYEISDDALILIKHHVLRRERSFRKVSREVEALENMEKLKGAPREPIPESVRLFVWQRDQGRCVKCGSQERLEFDHVIPIAAGGSNTDRNVQLLCESCNRSKGATV
jgi:hypothetical protein